jgi:hypothetical protein
MKHVILALPVFAAGVVASFAIAAPPPGHGPSSSSTSTSAGPGKSGEHAKAKCRPMNLKGTIEGGSITFHVTKAAGPKGKDLVNTDASLLVKGKVSAQAWACSSADSNAAPQLVLRQLHVGGSPQAPTTTTTP